MQIIFDPDRKLIIEDSSEDAYPINTAIDIVFIYSAWKRWVLLDNNIKYLPAFRYVGGDPISTTQNLGSTFFLTNGWKIKADEYDHRITLTGNLYTDPAGESPYVSTDGSYVITYETKVSNLVDSSIARLDLTQLLAAVYIDVNYGVPGTSEGIGTPTNPVNNIQDAFTIAYRDKLKEFKCAGELTLDRDVENWLFTGNGGVIGNIINVNGHDINGSKFTDMTLTGTMTGTVECMHCRLDVVYGLNGIFRSCGLVSSFLIEENATVTLESCYSEVPGTNTPICIFSANAAVNIRNYSGGIQLSNMQTSNVVSVDLDPGTCVIDSSSLGGIVNLRGTGILVDNRLPASTLVLVKLGLVEGFKLREIHQIHGLESGSPLTVTSTNRTAASISQRIATNETSGDTLIERL